MPDWFLFPFISQGNNLSNRTIFMGFSYCIKSSFKIVSIILIKNINAFCSFDFSIRYWIPFCFSSVGLREKGLTFYLHMSSLESRILLEVGLFVSISPSHPTLIDSLCHITFHFFPQESILSYFVVS